MLSEVFSRALSVQQTFVCISIFYVFSMVLPESLKTFYQSGEFFLYLKIIFSVKKLTAQRRVALPGIPYSSV